MSVTYRGKKFKVKKVKGSGLHLNLRKKKIEDISQISGLDEHSDLVSLNLDENQITEITGLSNLRDLRVLSLSDNQIIEITGLSNLRNLRVLSLSNNKIAEIKGLENLINLKELDLRKNQISEIKGLDNLMNLDKLILSRNNISELKGLESLVNLSFLGLHYNPVFDWIEEDLGIFGLAKTAVKYCARKTGKNRFNLEEVEIFLTLKKEEISTAVQKKEYYKVMKILREAHDEVKLDDRSLYYNFFGEFLWDYPQIFEKKSFLNEYYPDLKFFLTEKKVVQMETYVINKYCTYENEEVLTSFYGKLFSHKMVYTGRIHFTNFRVFVFGTKEEQSQSGPFIIGSNIPSLIESIIRGSIRKHIKKKGRELMSKYGGAGDIPSFGYQFPLINAKKVARKNNLGITCNLDNHQFDMGICPAQLNNENEQELSERIKYLAAIIPDT